MTWRQFSDVVNWTWGPQPDDLEALDQLVATLGAHRVIPFPVQVTVEALRDSSVGKIIRGVLPQSRGVYAIGVLGDQHRVLYVGSSGKDDGRVRKGGVGDRLWNGLHAPPDWLRAELTAPVGSVLSSRVRERLQSATRKKRRLRRADLYTCLLAAFSVDVVTLHVWGTEAPEAVESEMLNYCRTASTYGSLPPLHGT
jgi:hypothetical protein